MKPPVISARVEPSDIRALDRIARKTFRNRAQVIFQAVREFIQREKKENDHAR